MTLLPHIAAARQRQPKQRAHARRLAVAAATLTALAACAPAAYAGSYEVRSCFSAQDQNSWTPSAPWPHLVTAYSACGGGGDNRGITVRATGTSSPAIETVPQGVGGQMEFHAPPNARITRIRGDMWTEAHGGWITGLWDPDHNGWAHGGFGGQGWHYFDANGLNNHRYWLWLACAGGCWRAPDYVTGSAQMRHVVVTVNDNTLPGLNNPRGTLWSDGWMNSTRDLYWDWSDHEIGVRRVWATVGGAHLVDQYMPCDYTQRVPCPTWDQTTSMNAATSALPQGVNTLRLHVEDAAGNVQTAERTVRLDNTGPGQQALRPDNYDPERWRAKGGFTLSYSPAWIPGQEAPVVWSHVRLCPSGWTAENHCVSWTEHDPDHRIAVTPPYAGLWETYVVAQDEAGNSGQAIQPRANVRDGGGALIRYDPTAPGAPQLVARGSWVGAEAAAAFEQRIWPPADGGPPSGIAGYSVTVDGTAPDATIDAPGRDGVYAASHPLPEGAVRIRARAISGAGLPSNEIDETTAYVDLTPPAAQLAGAPERDEWQRTPTRLELKGSDALSGPGHVRWRIDDEPEQVIEGERGAIVVGSDGVHTVVGRTVDAAGNPSAPRSVAVKIDQTAPEALFERPDGLDPRAIRVRVQDRMSGVVDGRVELRRVGSDEKWTPLPSTLERARLFARIDDVALADGTYDLRAVVVDRAGNELTAEKREDGKPMQLTLPLRTRTAMRVHTRTVVRSVCRTVKVRGPRGTTRNRRICKPTRVPGGRAGLTVTIRPKSVRRRLLFGQLTTSSGTPLAGRRVTVTEQPRNRAGIRPLTELTTDSAGRFELPLLRGPSRTIRFTYAGNDTFHAFVGQAIILTTASTSFRVAPRTVAHGHPITFSGRLRGGWVPPSGIRVELEMRRHGHWQPFGTPVRTDGRGRWRLAWRFHGPLRGRVRAHVEREVGYPFEAGRTRSIRVRVRAQR